MSEFVTKYVTFTYYRLLIELSIDDAEAWVKGNRKSSAVPMVKSLIDAYKRGDVPIHFGSVINMIRDGKITSAKTNRGKLAELDVKTIKEEKDTIFFQLTNFRDVNIPTKKRPGQERTDIALEDDEYIGEFLSVIYQRSSEIIMVQSNRYALTKSQMEEYFSSLLYDVYQLDSSAFSFLDIELRPIIDINELKKINSNAIVNKFHLKGTSNSLRTLIPNDKKSMYSMRKLLEDFEGVEFEIIVKANYTKKHPKQLKIEPILEMLHDFSENPKADLPMIETHLRDADRRRAEAINWLIPTVQSVIPFKMEKRTSLSHEYVYSLMLPEFIDKNGRLIQLLLNERNGGGD